MKEFLGTKLGIISVSIFVLVMAVMLYRVVSKQQARKAHATAAVAAALARKEEPVPTATPAPAPIADPKTPTKPDATTQPIETLGENVAYLDQYYQLENRTRQDRDRQGNPVTRRENANTPTDASHVTVEDEPAPPPAPPLRSSLRLQGRGGAAPSTPLGALTDVLEGKIGNIAQTLGMPKRGTPPPLPEAPKPLAAAAPPARERPKRFNPYGSVIKCELVFAIDSTLDEAPLISTVMEPVYNNGQLVIPAGAELHGTVRTDRVRDRIFTSPEWVLVFPRERDRVNGRQLNVRGMALDRVEPDASGVTWGLTDGTYGLEGKIIRTMQDEEIKRFAAAFLAEAAQTMQERQVNHDGNETTRSTPQNAVLQGLSANLQMICNEITQEIARHGVYIRIAAGHQFYFYPTQIIDPDRADISSDIAAVK